MAPKRKPNNGSSSSSSSIPSVQVVTKKRKVSKNQDSGPSFQSRLEQSGQASSSNSSVSPAFASSLSKSKSNANSKSKSKSISSPVKSKPSARALLASQDSSFESSLQSSFSSPYSSENDYQISKRSLPLNRIHQREGSSFEFPTLCKLCLDVMAENWDTCILPSRESFQELASASNITRISNTERHNSSDMKSRKIKNIRGKTGRKSSGRFATTTGYNEEEDEDYHQEEEDSEILDSSRDTSRNANRIDGERNKHSKAFPQMRMTTERLEASTLSNHSLLKILPSRHLVELLDLLIQKSPNNLTKQTLLTYFITSKQVSEVRLSPSILLINQSPSIVASLVSNINLSNLKRLELIGLTRLTEASLIHLFKKSSKESEAETVRGNGLKLETLSLKGCVQIGDLSIQSLARLLGDQRSNGQFQESSLKKLDLGFTDCSLIALEEVLKAFSGLEKLGFEEVGKLRRSGKLTDQKLPSLMDSVISHHLSSSPPSIPLKGLTHLKIGNNDLGDVALGVMLKLCGKKIRKLGLEGSRIGAAGDLDVLRMGLGLELPDREIDRDRERGEREDGFEPEVEVGFGQEDLELKTFCQKNQEKEEEEEEEGESTGANSFGTPFHSTTPLPRSNFTSPSFFNSKISHLISLNLSSSTLTTDSLLSLLTSLCNQDGIRGMTNLRKLNLSNQKERIRTNEMKSISNLAFGNIVNVLAGVVRRRFVIWRRHEMRKLTRFLKKRLQEEEEEEEKSREIPVEIETDQARNRPKESEILGKQLLWEYFHLKDDFQDFIAFEDIDLSFNKRIGAFEIDQDCLNRARREARLDFLKFKALESFREDEIGLLDRFGLFGRYFDMETGSHQADRNQDRDEVEDEAEMETVNDLDYFMSKIGWSVKKLNLSGISLPHGHSHSHSQPFESSEISSFASESPGNEKPQSLSSSRIQSLFSMENLVHQPAVSNIRKLNLKDIKELNGSHLRRLAGNCEKLEAVYLGGTIEPSDLDWMIAKNSFLTSLDVSACRAVPIRERRSYLEVYDSKHPRHG